MHFHCREHNDLYRTLENAGHSFPRYDSLAEAVEAAAPGDAVLSLADTYPRPVTVFDEQLAATVRDKQLKLYLEYPAEILGDPLPGPQRAKWERAVVTSDALGTALPSGRILSMHACWYLPVDQRDALLTLAKVAGYNDAVYGLPAERCPLLYLMADNVLVATSKLSHFVTGRYAPKPRWQSLWEWILTWLGQEEFGRALAWESPVTVSAGPADPLSPDAEEAAVDRVVHWFKTQAVYGIDQKKGVIEGFGSLIDHEGRQMRRVWVRADCIAEAAMLFACDWAVRGDPASKLAAAQMLDYVWSSDFYHADPESPAYGLINWYERGPIFYGDDNARVLLAALATARYLADDQWTDRILISLLGNLRTSGKLGFRRHRVTMADFERLGGWRPLREEEFVLYAPHYECYLWACFLWGYSLTGYEEFLRAAKAALGMTMEAYPEWRWTNGLTQEIARMILPLAFLVRVEDTEEHREWLKRMVQELLAYMQPCGAIREGLGKLELGRYSPPKSNEAYGTNEASLIQTDGDPASDLLYTMNFAFLGLHEAAMVTGDSFYAEAADRIAEFFCRIQIKSSDPCLDGAWMRSFDYTLWEYWGSSADAGWGPWCIESGWTNTWIGSVMMMRRLGHSLFDTKQADSFRAVLPETLRLMELEE